MDVQLCSTVASRLIYKVQHIGAREAFDLAG